MSVVVGCRCFLLCCWSLRPRSGREPPSAALLTRSCMPRAQVLSLLGSEEGVSYAITCAARKRGRAAASVSGIVTVKAVSLPFVTVETLPGLVNPSAQLVLRGAVRYPAGGGATLRNVRWTGTSAPAEDSGADGLASEIDLSDPRVRAPQLSCLCLQALPPAMYHDGKC